MCTDREMKYVYKRLKSVCLNLLLKCNLSLTELSPIVQNMLSI